MRLYNLYKLNILQKLESESITKTNVITQVNKSPMGFKGLNYLIAPHRKSIVTEQDKKILYPYLQHTYASLDGSKSISQKESILGLSVLTKCRNLLSNIPQCKNLEDITELIENNKVTEVGELTADQLIQILDTLLIQMHKLNIEKFGISLNVISLKSDITKVWYDEVDDNYNLLAEVMEKFSQSRKKSINKYKTVTSKKVLYKNFLAYAKEELSCLYSLILCLGS